MYELPIDRNEPIILYIYIYIYMGTASLSFI